MIPWWTPVMGEREKERVCEVIDRNFPNDGEYTEEFERQIAALLGVPYAVATTSGTTAIFLALAAVGVGAGDEVIVPDMTFIATANAVKLTGANPVLVDVQRSDFNVDPAAIARAITSRTKAIVPVHVSGRGADMPSIRSLAERFQLRIIEDAAEALGSLQDGRALGTLGDAGCFSFSPNKTITTGQGGMVVTGDESIYQRLKQLKDHGRPIRGTGGDDEHPTLGYNFKLTNLQAAMGLAQLEQFQMRLAHQRDVYEIYRTELEGVPGLRLPGFNTEHGERPQWVDVYVDGRDSLHDFLLARDIHSRKFWFPLHSQTPYKQTDERFQGSIAVSRNALWLPSPLTMNRQDQLTVCRVIREWASLR